MANGYVRALATKTDTTAMSRPIYRGSASVTTSGNGNASVDFAQSSIVLSAWCDVDGVIVGPFPSNPHNGEGGSTRWWFHFMQNNSNHTIKASTSLTLYYTYTTA